MPSRDLSQHKIRDVAGSPKSKHRQVEIVSVGKIKRSEIDFTIRDVLSEPLPKSNPPVNSHLLRHAIETFGSEKTARQWLSTECGELNNETPANFMKKTGNADEVERILGCIDYGMIA